MLGYIAVFLSGLLFALGLGISGMTLPQKVLAFLDVAGDWDPSLALVMIGSAGVYLILHRPILRLSHPVFDTSFHLPSRDDIDRPLVIGAALFGVGWGTVGFCPGPAVTALVAATGQVFIFFVAMAVGMYLSAPIMKAGTAISRHMAAVDG
jgi:uncharacterized membrane protein YedE/YeeE